MLTAFPHKHDSNVIERRRVIKFEERRFLSLSVDCLDQLTSFRVAAQEKEVQKRGGIML